MPSVKVWGGISVLNALFLRKGSVIAVRLPMTVTVERASQWEGDRELVRLESSILKEIGGEGPMSIKVASDIPQGVGLKSSSALTVGLALASMLALGMTPDPFLAVKASARASLAMGISYTGAWDDAYASALGGLVISDNKTGRLITRAEMDENLVIAIYLKGGEKKAVDQNGFRALRELAGVAFEELIKGNVFQAIVLNGVLVAAANGYDAGPIAELLKDGAIAAGISGNGPAYFGVFRSSGDIPKIDGAKQIITAPANEGFKVV